VDPPFGDVGTAELETILLAPFPCGTSPCINQTIFGPTAASRYWSAITVEAVPFAAWIVDFDDGFFDFSLKDSIIPGRPARDWSFCYLNI